MQNSMKVSNYIQAIRAICRQRQKLFMLDLMVKSFNHQLVKLRLKDVYLFYVFLTTIINH
jgi:hypothetical protein